MAEKFNLIEKLQEIQKSEVKRRSKAKEYLEKIVEVLAPVMREIKGSVKYYEGDETEAIWIPIYNKEKEKYDYRGTDLYFRYGEHYTENGTQEIGFYINYDMPYWGTNVLDLTGDEFWIRVKQITDWINNYLPEYIENKMKSREKRLSQLEKTIESLSSKY